MIDVDFEWFNFDKDIDFPGVKNLLRQLLDVDSTLFDTSALANIIVAQNSIGSTIKVDGKNKDPFAFLTVLSLSTRSTIPALAQLVDYLIEKSQTNSSLAPVAQILRENADGVGLVISERMINMPVEAAPPLYSMLLDEVEAAVEDKEPFEFTHWLVLSRSYNEVESTLEIETERKRKKVKEEPARFYFHAEDELLLKHATAHGQFNYAKEAESSADSKRAFQDAGIKPHGFMMLFEADKFPVAVGAISDSFQLFE